jgi:hypothetical protein
MSWLEGERGRDSSNKRRARSPALSAVLIAFLPGFSNTGSAFVFYVLMGLVIIAVGWLTDYSGPPTKVLSRIVLEFGDAFRGSINLADQAARSMI